MKRRPPPSLAALMDMYSYNPETGEFWFNYDVGTRGRKGHTAGAKRVDGYIGIALEGKIYLAHHLAWFYYYGTWPYRIDHIDRVKNHNWIDNLRPATAKQNLMNSLGWRPKNRKNKWPKGVYLDPTKSKKPFAAIKVDGKLRRLGFFNTVEEAAEAYRKASLEIHGEFSPFK